jgi:aminomethyltransferase
VVNQVELRRTPLHSRHLARGAKTADFGGWDMPIEYVGTVAEHTAVRTTVGLFDVSHMGKVSVTGAGALEFLNGVLANDLNRIHDGKAQYSMLCNAEGGVIDDLIVYRWSPEHIFIIPNASNAATVVSALRAVAPDGVSINDQHDALGIIAIQGPQSRSVLRAIGVPADLDYMSMVKGEYAGAEVVVCRTGYTGELGFEIVAPSEILGVLWDDLCLHAEAVEGMPAGLGARDTLRTEMGYPLHGQDISPAISPVQAGISWAIGWQKPEFQGRNALTEQRSQGVSKHLVALIASERGIPRPHMEVFDSTGENLIGEVTSGTFSPTLKQGIALALVESGIRVGDVVLVDIRGRKSSFSVTALPLVPSSTR